MPVKMNLDYLQLLCCEFQKYKNMNMPVLGGQPKKKKTNKMHETHFSNLIIASNKDTAS